MTAVTFRHRQPTGRNATQIGSEQRTCDIPGCRKAAIWHATCIGHPVGDICDTHRLEWLGVIATAIGSTPERPLEAA